MLWLLHEFVRKSEKARHELSARIAHSFCVQSVGNEVMFTSCRLFASLTLRWATFHNIIRRTVNLKHKIVDKSGRHSKIDITYFRKLCSFFSLIFCFSFLFLTVFILNNAIQVLIKRKTNCWLSQGIFCNSIATQPKIKNYAKKNDYWSLCVLLTVQFNETHAHTLNKNEYNFSFHVIINLD